MAREPKALSVEDFDTVGDEETGDSAAAQAALDERRKIVGKYRVDAPPR